MKTLICLLSGQLVPNLMSCKMLRPERIVLVETTKMQNSSAAQNFQDALKKMGVNVETQIETVPEGDDNNFPNLMDFFKALRLKFPEDQFYVNLTGGTKPMSIALYETFKAPELQAEFYYCDVDHPCRITNFHTNESRDDSQISLDAFLAVYGYQTSKDAKRIESAENRALSRAQTTKLLAYCCNESDFRIWQYSKEQNDAKKDRKWITDAMDRTSPTSLKPGILRPSTLEIDMALVDCFNLDHYEDGSLRGNLESQEFKYLDGGWLEEFIWLILREYKEKYQLDDLDDLHLGQVIRKNGSTTTNELDVSFMRNNMLYVLECKTGLQEKMQENEYKLFAVSKQVQAIRTKTFLISNSKNLAIQEVQDRAKLYSTELIDKDEIHQMALDPEDVLDKRFNFQKK